MRLHVFCVTRLIRVGWLNSSVWCDMTHSYCVTWLICIVWHDSFILCDMTHLYCVTWLIHRHDSFGCVTSILHVVWRDSFILCDMTHLYCVTWLIHVVCLNASMLRHTTLLLWGDMYLSEIWCDFLFILALWRDLSFQYTRCTLYFAWHGSFIFCGMTTQYLCDVTHSVGQVLATAHPCDMTHSHCDMTHSYCVTWLIHFVWHDSSTLCNTTHSFGRDATLGRIPVLAHTQGNPHTHTHTHSHDLWFLHQVQLCVCAFFYSNAHARQMGSILCVCVCVCVCMSSVGVWAWVDGGVGARCVAASV